MPAARDPLSVTSDRQVRHVILLAIRAHQENPRRPRQVRMWLASPSPQFRDLDRGGLTANERAFQRSVYYQTWRVPINEGVTPQWSAKLYWGRIEKRGGRWGRNLRLRLYLYRRAVRHVDRNVPRRQQWRDDVAGGRTRSVTGARIDETG